MEPVLLLFGDVALEKAIAPPDERRFDLHFVPRSDGPPDLPVAQHLRLLRRMARRECVMEFFAGTPSVDVLRDCTSKHLDHHLSNRRVARKAKAPRPRLSRLWVVSPGRPLSAMRRFQFRPARSWPAGFYRSGSAFRLWLVVLSELPAGRETLLLRLLGNARGRLDAAREIRQLSPDDPIRRPLLRVLAHVKFVLERDPTVGTAEERELMSNLLAEFERYEADVFRRGETRGRANSLLSILAARGLPVSDDARRRILACEDVNQLEIWLARAISVSSVDGLLHAN
jgi:hypothetical protein